LQVRGDAFDADLRQPVDRSLGDPQGDRAAGRVVRQGRQLQGQAFAEIARADTVVLETVEREMTFRASDLGLLSAKFLEQLRRGLPRRAG
jgi:hypothetical protein